MSVTERDKYTGHMTTGHEWNGIKELNTPVPFVLIAFLAAAFLFALGYWIFMPAWPLGNTYTKGTLGFDQRDHLEQELAQGRDNQAHWTKPFEELDFDSIQNDPVLMNIVHESGPALFDDNCAMCHGSTGDGGRFFPRLNDAQWLWGSQPDAILHTLTHGINSGHSESRFAVMPPFGSSGVLSGSAIENLVSYLQSISTTESATTINTLATGKELFTLYCAGCHAPDGTGNIAVGGPNLTDDFWIYGGDTESLTTTLNHGRKGHMPAWGTRLSLNERKILTVYVLSLAEATNTAPKP